MANVGLTEYLMEFGLTRQEATIYLNLMERGMHSLDLFFDAFISKLRKLKNS